VQKAQGNGCKVDINKYIYNSLMKNKGEMKRTLLTLRLTAIMTLWGFIITIMIITSSSGFFLSSTPALGQEDDLGNFSIMNTTELAGGSNASQVYVIPEQGEEVPSSPPSSEAPQSFFLF
jgi:hypothetical protein